MRALWMLAAWAVAAAAALPAAGPGGAQATVRPNVLVAIADDWSWPHAAIYGDAAVRTPVVDRLAREGVLFTHAFTAAPSCTPARAALLSGQHPHRLGEGAMLWGFLPSRVPVYPDLLERAGYHVGVTGKGWGPGRHEAGGRTRNPAGPAFPDFATFLKARPAGAPFAFWFGSQDPHRPYEPGSGARAGVDPARIRIPPFLPDRPEVRHDLADYLAEVQRFDRDLGELVARLEALGELDRTLLIVTSDNGMPFPRAKANVYDAGARVPLVVRWPEGIRGSRRIDALVSLGDLAPTVLAAAGLAAPEEMTGRNLLPLMAGTVAGVHEGVLVSRERHANVRQGDASYPVRAWRTREHLYVRNFRPDRWPAGDPATWFAVGPFGDIDGGPTKSLLLDRREDPAIRPFFLLATARRPAEELYDLRTDPDQVRNVAGQPAYRAVRDRMRKALDGLLTATGDPRLVRDDDRWDRYPYFGGPAAREPVAPPGPPPR